MLACVEQGVTETGLGALASASGSRRGATEKALTSLWLGLPSPELGTGAAVWFSGLIAWFVPIAALASVLFAAFRMATSGTFEAGRDLGGSLMRLVLVTGLVTFMTTTALQLGDMLADWLVHDHASAAVVRALARWWPQIRAWCCCWRSSSCWPRSSNSF